MSIFKWLRDRAEKREREAHALWRYRMELDTAYRWLSEFDDVCLFIDFLNARASNYDFDDREKMPKAQSNTLFMDMNALREKMRRLRKDSP